MIHRVSIAFIVMIAALALSLIQPATAQVRRGAARGAAAGAIVGGIAGGGRGAAIGAMVGAATGAAIGREARRSRGRYYMWRGNCYYRGRHGHWYRASRWACR
jgi:outer membrane lipoprotein SlyB